MANEIRVRQNFIGGLVEDDPLTNVATTLTSAALAAVQVIDSTQHMPIIIGPDSSAPEIAYITAHTASASTATIARGKEGTTAIEWPVDTPWIHGPVVSDSDSDGTGLLALIAYDPGVITSLSTSSTSYADIDATNLAVTFTVPPSGKILVKLSALANAGTASSVGWNLREGGSDVANTSQRVVSCPTVSASQMQIRPHYVMEVTGLTPGDSKTYTWGHARIGGSATSGTAYGGAIGGQATMEVWAVNV